MKGLLTLIIFLPAFFCGHSGFGQDTASRFSVVLSPAIFVPVSVAIQGGLQYRMNKRWSFLAEVAVPTFHPNGTGYDDIDYLRINSELKYRPSKTKKSTGYLALQTAYLFRKFTDKSAGVFETKDMTFSYSSARINTPVLSSAFKLGFEVPGGKKIFFDLFFGMGVRIVFTNYDADNIFPTQPVGGRHFGPESAWRYNYTLARFHFTSGMKVGLRL